MEHSDTLILSELRYAVYHDLQNSLQNNDMWKGLALELQRRNVVTLVGGNIIDSAETLLRQLCMKAYTVEDLAVVLDDLQLEKPLMVLRDHEPVEIYEQPERTKIVFEGANNFAELECRARGFPYPCYQWLKKGPTGYEELNNQKQSTLHISPLRLEDSGTYKCIVYNQCEDVVSSIHSDEAEVRVLSDGSSQSKGSPLPDWPSIKRQPVAPSSRVSIGASFTLDVLASCKYPLKYKWYKNKQELQGADKEYLKIEHLKPEGAKNSWSYQCQVYTEHGRSVISDEVRFSLDVAESLTRFTAEDKVALLIGNGDYKFLEKLKCAVNDVTTLSNLLTSLDFKVIAMYNLTRPQMTMVIDWFCELLESGVYAVFYYVGHGYELRKQCYMLPLEVPYEYKNQHAISVDYVYERIQKHSPDLCVMLLDMCRIQANGHPDIHKEATQCYAPPPHPNTCNVYATTSSCRAFELKGEPNGIFIKYLKDHITEDISLKDLFINVKKEMIADPLAGSEQYAWEETNLPYDRRLTDVVVHETSEKAQKRKDFFNTLNACPDDSMLQFDDKHISVALQFNKHKYYLQNGLDIKVTVIHAVNATSWYGAYVTTANADVEWLQGYDTSGKDIVKHNIIHNLQKLKEPLMIDIVLKDLVNRALPEETWTIQLYTPLIAGFFANH